MRRASLLPPLLALFSLLLVLLPASPVSAQGGGGAGPLSTWNTLSGRRPLVIAKGGFSGGFPDSSDLAYKFANLTSLIDVAMWCDVQVTKDGVGLCLPDINLDNCTDIRSSQIPVFRNRTYDIGGQNLTGWFTSDYTQLQLQNVSLVQGIYSRTPRFDFQTILPISYFNTFNTQPVWLNFQHARFYTQQRQNLTKLVEDAINTTPVFFISSPELSFLQTIAPMAAGFNISVIYRFMSDGADPTTGQLYTSLAKNLTFLGKVANGIMIPKSFIWPTVSGNYLASQPTLDILVEARRRKLQVYVSDFQNDVVIPFNYSYDPVEEYLNYINLGNVSVDGFLTDFPTSASEAIGCFAHPDLKASTTGKPTVVSFNGFSGDYPGCTDVAYQKAVEAGADYIDCPVRFTKDGTIICMGSVNLLLTSTVATSAYGTRFSSIPEIQAGNGIFTFNLTWDEIKTNLKPAISNPLFDTYKLVRNPAFQNEGKFMALQDFLDFALNSTTLKGVVITIEHAPFLTGKLAINVTDSVINALATAGLDKQTKLDVMIQSQNSSALIPFKQLTKYKILYKINQPISKVEPAALADIKKFADAVSVRRDSIFPTNAAFVMNQTGVVDTLRSVNLSVFSHRFMNEFVSPPWDFLADPYTEIHNHVEGAKIDGVIDDFPESASRYRGKTCKRENYDIPIFQPGLLLSLMQPLALPDKVDTPPPLTATDVRELPLPPAISPTATGGEGTPAVKPSGQVHILPSLTVLAMSLALLLVTV